MSTSLESLSCQNELADNAHDQCGEPLGHISDLAFPWSKYEIDPDTPLIDLWHLVPLGESVPEFAGWEE